jgi:hypothetical protein
MRTFAEQIKSLIRILGSTDRRGLLPGIGRRALLRLLVWSRLGRIPVEVEISQSIQSGFRACDIVYINLDRRVDRRASIEDQFRRLGIDKYTRFRALEDANAGIGCALSHIAVLASWDRRHGRLLAVCEDDVTFLASREEFDAVITEFAQNDGLDVLCLQSFAAWNIPISEQLQASSGVISTGCYLVKAKSVDALITSFQKSVHRLQRGGNYEKYAIDQGWKRVQMVRLFARPQRRVCGLLNGYSDIEGVEMNYEKWFDADEQ